MSQISFINKYIVMKYNLNNKILEAVNRGIHFALDDFDDQELQGQTNSKVSHKHGIFEEILLLQGFVDLDLPSGTLWNAYNLGVDPNHLDNYQYWNGGYYQWGESEPAFNQLIDNEIIKNKFVGVKQKYRYDYNTGKKGFYEIQPEDDPVSIYYKSEKYHIPSEEQFEELKNNTTKKFVENYKNVQHLDGLLLTGKNGKEIFFPANGFIDNTGYRHYLGNAVYCWANNKSYHKYTWHDTMGNIQDDSITGDEYGSCCFSYHNSNSQYDYISISDMVSEHAAGIRPVINL